MKKKLFSKTITYSICLALLLTFIGLVGSVDLKFKGNRYYDISIFPGTRVSSFSYAYSKIVQIKTAPDLKILGDEGVSNIFYDEIISQNKIDNYVGSILLDHGYCVQYMEEMRARGQIPDDYQLPKNFDKINTKLTRPECDVLFANYVPKYKREMSTSTTTASATSPTSSDAFDPVYYAEHNPDVVAALGTDPAVLKQHYEMFGKMEGRKAHK